MDPLNEVFDQYVEKVASTILENHKEINIKTKVLFTYTAMHGVGYKYVRRLFDEIAISMVPVEEQKDPHPDFPTVK